MRRSDLVPLGLIFALAFGLRFHDLERPRTRWLDENANIDGAVHYWEEGEFEPDTWEHPPLRHLTGYAFLRAFGDNPYGWRLRNVIFGAVAAALAWLLAFRVGDRRAALLAGLLVATDPLHVVLSRFTFEEVLGGTLFLASVVLLLFHRKRTSWLVASALLMGCALATKWYFVPGWGLLLLLLLWDGGAWRDRGTAAFLAVVWTLVPLGVYLATFAPWFGRGYRLWELTEFTLNAYRHLQAMTEFSVRAIDQRAVFHAHMSASEWFVRPIWLGEGKLLGAERGMFIMYANGFPVWALVLPAVVVTIALAVRRRRWELAFPAAIFLATWAFFLPVARPVMIYSAAPLLPFAFATIALAVSWGSDRLGAGFTWGAAALLVGWNLYLYPLVTAHDVPLAAYRLVLDYADLVLH